MLQGQVCTGNSHTFGLSTKKLSLGIPVICHQRTSTAGVLFSIWRTFFHRERERDHSEHAMPYHAIPINKYAKQKQQVHQSKQQICHLNQKNTPTKTPSTPSQSKEYATKTPNTQSQSKEYANVNFSPQY